MSTARLATAQKWGFKEFQFKCEYDNDQSKVTSIMCIICKEFYNENPNELNNLKGQTKTQVQNWINGSTTIKKTMLKSI